MRTFTVSQIGLVLKLMKAPTKVLVPIANLAKSRQVQDYTSRCSKADLIGTILRRIGDEDLIFQRSFEHDHLERQRRTIEALIQAQMVYGFWFPSYCDLEKAK